MMSHYAVVEVQRSRHAHGEGGILALLKQHVFDQVAMDSVSLSKEMFLSCCRVVGTLPVSQHIPALCRCACHNSQPSSTSSKPANTRRKKKFWFVAFLFLSIFSILSL